MLLVVGGYKVKGDPRLSVGTGVLGLSYGKTLECEVDFFLLKLLGTQRDIGTLYRVGG